MPVQTIDDTLYDAFGQRQISTIFTQLNQYRVVLEVDPDFRTSADLLNKLTVRGNGNGALTGSNATTLGQATSSNSATPSRHRQHRQYRLRGRRRRHDSDVFAGQGASRQNAPLVDQPSESAAGGNDFVQPRAGLFAVAGGRRGARGRATMHLPPQVRGRFIGKAAEFSASLGDEVLLMLASLIVIYIVLGVLYESYIHPITIISTLPPAGVGALLALMVCGMGLSIDGIVGIILLIGIVKKNAIMMIDFAIEAQRDGMNAHDAIRRACLLRFRPIMMTTRGGAFRRTAARARQRHRFGIAQTARCFDRRRLAAVAVDHAVYDAGDLSVFRAVVGLGEGAARAACGAAGACGMNPVSIVRGGFARLPSPNPLPQAGEGEDLRAGKGETFPDARANWRYSPSPACGRGLG